MRGTHLETAVTNIRFNCGKIRSQLSQMNAELQVILLDAVLVDSTICLFSAPTLKRITALCSRSTAQDVQYLSNLQTG